MLIDNETGQALPKDMPEHLLLEEKVERGKIAGLGHLHFSNHSYGCLRGYGRYLKVY